MNRLNAIRRGLAINPLTKPWLAIPTLLPVIYILTVMWWIPDGSKYVLGIVAVCFVIFTFGQLILKAELEPQPRSIKLVAIALWLFVVYSTFIYLTDGGSWKQLKAFIAVAIYSLMLRKVICNQTFIYTLIFISGAGFSILSWVLFFLSDSRVGGFINPVPYATAVSALTVACFTLSLSNKKGLIKFTFIALTVSLFTALLLTQTRGVIIPTTLVLLTVYFVHSVSLRGLLKTLGGSVAAITFISTAAFFISDDRIERTSHEISMISEGNFSTSIGLRLIMWDAAVEIWKTAPITGVGDTHLKVLDKLLEEEKVHHHFKTFVPSHYHNQYLNELVEKGILGFLIFTTVIIAVLKLVLEAKSDQLKTAALLVILIYLLSSLSNVPFKGPDTIYLFFALLFTLSAQPEKEPKHLKSQ